MLLIVALLATVYDTTAVEVEDFPTVVVTVIVVGVIPNASIMGPFT